MSNYQGVASSATIERPANTDDYAVGDAVSTTAGELLSFAGIHKDGGAVYIVKAILLTDLTTNVATYRLHLFNDQPTAIADNAACTAPLYADAAKYVGYIDFAALAPGGSTSAFAQVDDCRLHALLPEGALYGILQTTAVFTPASEQAFTVVLSMDRVS